MDGEKIILDNTRRTICVHIILSYLNYTLFCFRSYSCFGYTIENADLLKGVKEGDIIKTAKVISGNDKLVLPQEAK